MESTISSCLPLGKLVISEVMILLKAACAGNNTILLSKRCITEANLVILSREGFIALILFKPEIFKS